MANGWQSRRTARPTDRAFEAPPPMSTLSTPRVTPALAKSAREHFQERYPRALNDDDGREIATNLLGLFQVLQDWTQRAATVETPTTPLAPASPVRRRATRT